MLRADIKLSECDNEWPRRYVQGLGAPLKFLCGASDVQPKECMDHHESIKRKC